jgi:arylsulfatase A
MGMFDTTGSPLKKGFDHFYGYNCQRHAHSYFPKYLWKNDQRVELDGKTYAMDLIGQDTLDWVRSHASSPFFLFYAITLPHGKFEIDDLGQYKDKPWTQLQKTYAAMVTRLDSDVGRLLDLLKETEGGRKHPRHLQRRQRRILRAQVRGRPTLRPIHGRQAARLQTQPL